MINWSQIKIKKKYSVSGTWRLTKSDSPKSSYLKKDLIDKRRIKPKKKKKKKKKKEGKERKENKKMKMKITSNEATGFAVPNGMSGRTS